MVGIGVNLIIYNGTRHRFWRRDHHQYQMNSWNLPGIIEPDYIKGTYVEWNTAVGVNKGDDAGEALYNILDTSFTFQVQARYRNGPIIYLYLDGMSSLSQPYNSMIEIPYRPNTVGYPIHNSMEIVIAGEDGKFVCNSTQQLNYSWMQINLPTLGDRSLRRICMPSSHDSGMSEVGKGTVFGTAHFVQTQTKNVKEQLGLGVRYLDIRPVISGAHFYTGHYSYTGDKLGWQGANGQSLDSVIEQINSFTYLNPELVIVKLAGARNTDEGYRDLNEQEWNRLHGELRRLNSLFSAPAGTADLTELKLNQFIKNSKPAVIVIFPEASGNSLGSYEGNGFYYTSKFPMFDEYADSDDPATMWDNQFAKLKAQRDTIDARVFSLDWTLTQQGIGSALGPSVLELAHKANTWLLEKVQAEYNRTVFPNFISVDKVENTDPLALATAINTYMTRLWDTASDDPESTKSIEKSVEAS